MAGNYNILMKQPPIFYPVAIVLALEGADFGAPLRLAWAYVAVRVAHSLVHALVDLVIVRFAPFALASVILAVMAVWAAVVVVWGTYSLARDGKRAYLCR